MVACTIWVLWLLAGCVRGTTARIEVVAMDSKTGEPRRKRHRVDVHWVVSAPEGGSLAPVMMLEDVAGWLLLVAARWKCRLRQRARWWFC
jgi:hypothetical protein